MVPGAPGIASGVRSGDSAAPAARSWKARVTRSIAWGMLTSPFTSSRDKTSMNTFLLLHHGAANAGTRETFNV